MTSVGDSSWLVLAAALLVIKVELFVLLRQR
jgi:hypothetical protein